MKKVLHQSLSSSSHLSPLFPCGRLVSGAIGDLKRGFVSEAEWLAAGIFVGSVQEAKGCGKEWRTKGKRGGLSTCQSKGVRSDGDTCQKGTWVEQLRDAEGRRRDSQSTESVCSPLSCSRSVVVAVVAVDEDGVLGRGRAAQT